MKEKMKREVKKEWRDKRFEEKRERRQVIQEMLAWSRVKKSRRRKGGGRAKGSRKEWIGGQSWRNNSRKESTRMQSGLQWKRMEFRMLI